MCEISKFHVETYMKAVYVIKCIYIPLWKGVFFVLKDFDQSQELKTIAKKSLQFYMFPT